MARGGHTHLPDELLDSLVDSIVAEAELVGNALCLLCQGHAASCVSADVLVEGAGAFDSVRRSRTDGRVVVERVLAEGDGGGSVVLCSEAQELVRKARG